MGTFRVEITESATEERRGFLSREFEDVYEAKKAIRARIDLDRIAAREFAFTIIDNEGLALWTTYYDDVYRDWDAFEG